MRTLPFLLCMLSPLPGAFAGDLYKCVDAAGKVEYANGPCRGKAEKFQPRRGSVTRLTLPKVEPAKAPAGTGGTVTAEQKKQMEELGIQPGGAVKMKPLVIPESWLK